MNSYYEILGLQEGASEEQVRAAYKALAKKHSPNLAQSVQDENAALDAMEQINNAFDKIMEQLRLHGGAQDSDYIDARALINSGDLQGAEALLKSKHDEHSAEWNFLMGTVYYSRGYINNAVAYFETAVSLDGTNAEYSAALNRIRTGAGSAPQYGSPYQKGGSNMGCSCCDVCTAFICIDACCSFGRCCC